MTALQPPLVKICGLRTVEAAVAAAESGADFLGFNFAPVSRRRVDPTVARAATSRVRLSTRRDHPSCHPERSEGSPSSPDQHTRPFGPAAVGIFVNQPIDEIAFLAESCALDYLQLSGNEDPAYCAALSTRAGLPIIKAVRLARAEDADQVETYVANGTVTMLLADASVPGSWGGAGEAWDWWRVRSLAARVPLLLAGGLTPDNVAGAIAAVRPHGVDVASGVETNGHTDPIKVRAFIRAAKRSPVEAPLSPGLPQRGTWERGRG